MDTDSFVFEIQESTKLWLDKQSREKKEELRQKTRFYQKKQVSKPYGTSQRVVGYRGLYSQPRFHLFLGKSMCHYLLKSTFLLNNVLKLCYLWG